MLQSLVKALPGEGRLSLWETRPHSSATTKLLWHPPAQDPHDTQNHPRYRLIYISSCKLSSVKHHAESDAHKWTHQKPRHHFYQGRRRVQGAHSSWAEKSGRCSFPLVFPKNIISPSLQFFYNEFRFSSEEHIPPQLIYFV